MAELTQDSEYLEKRAMTNNAVVRLNTKNSRSVGEGIVHGADAVIGGLARGVAGVFADPIQGALRLRPEPASPKALAWPSP